MNRTRQVVVVLLLFTAVGVLRHLHQFGEDLGSSYIACRLLAVGQGNHLYSHSPYVFSRVADPVWYNMARRTGFFPLRMLHPYVQTPLWAWSLEPICTRMNYRAFCNGFMVLFMLCMSGTLWLVAKYWASRTFHPGWMALVCLVFYRSEPFKYAIFLAQTHILYVLMAVLAVILAEQKRPVWAGLLLAFAAGVKITPGVLLIYWLVTRRYKAGLSFTVASAALVLLPTLIFGPGLMHDYLRSFNFNSNVLLYAFNNQSLAAWWTTLTYPRGGMLHWGIYFLPHSLKLICGSLTIVAAIFGGWLDRQNLDRGMADGQITPPYGAIIALLAATLCAPIAWTHYFIMLVIPAMLFLDARLKGGSAGWIILLGGIVLLNYYPFSMGAVHVYYKSLTIIRGEFYSTILAIAGLVYLALERARTPFSEEKIAVAPHLAVSHVG